MLEPFLVLCCELFATLLLGMLDFRGSFDLVTSFLPTRNSSPVPSRFNVDFPPCFALSFSLSVFWFCSVFVLATSPRGSPPSCRAKGILELPECCWLLLPPFTGIPLTALCLDTTGSDDSLNSLDVCPLEVLVTVPLVLEFAGAVRLLTAVSLPDLSRLATLELTSARFRGKRED